MTLKELNVGETCGDFNIILDAEGNEIGIKNFISAEEKADLILYVVDNVIDPNTGCASPIRTHVYLFAALVKWYTNIELENISAQEIYDYLYGTQLGDNIMCSLIPSEKQVITDLVNSTIEDIVRYNNSFTGMMALMNSDATNLGQQIQDIVAQMQNKESLEALNEFKNMVGTD